MVRQANWHMTEGASPPKRRNNRSTFLREPCVWHPRGVGEASVAARAGGLLSAVTTWSGVPRPSLRVEGNTGRVAMVRPDRAPRRPRTHARTYVICRDLGGLRVVPVTAGTASGRREAVSR